LEVLGFSFCGSVVVGAFPTSFALLAIAGRVAEFLTLIAMFDLKVRDILFCREALSLNKESVLNAAVAASASSLKMMTD
jgi:hypothetical protein